MEAGVFRVFLHRRAGLRLQRPLTLNLHCSCCFRNLGHTLGRSTLQLEGVLVRLLLSPRPRNPTTSRPVPWPPTLSLWSRGACVIEKWTSQFSIALSACSAALRLCRTAASTSCVCCCCSFCICSVSEIDKSTPPSPLLSETRSGHQALIFFLAPSSPARTFSGVQLLLEDFSQPWFHSPSCDGSRIHCCSLANRLCSSSGLGERVTTESTCASRCPHVRKIQESLLPSSQSDLAALHFAVACLASAPFKEPLNDGVCAAIANTSCSTFWRMGQPTLRHYSKKKVRGSERLARARLCFELSGSRPGTGLVATS